MLDPKKIEAQFPQPPRISAIVQPQLLILLKKCRREGGRRHSSFDDAIITFIASSNAEYFRGTN